jgi:hypothetical protein
VPSDILWSGFVQFGEGISRQEIRHHFIDDAVTNVADQSFDLSAFNIISPRTAPGVPLV